MAVKIRTKMMNEERLPVRRQLCLSCADKVSQVYDLDRSSNYGDAKCDECGKKRVSAEWIVRKKGKNESGKN